MSSPRPVFEPVASDEPKLRAPAAPAPLLSWLRLMRLPNVFTALADVTMGFLFVRQSLEPLGGFICLATASALLYTAGMVLNDVLDIDIDARERPGRPLPSGQIALPLARALGFAMLGLGVLFGWLAGIAFAQAGTPAWRGGLIATLLAAAVIAYDAWLKRTPLGPLGMGLCRSLNVLLGMSLASEFVHPWLLSSSPDQLLAAGGIGLYIIGVTWFARNEAGNSPVWQLLAAMAVMAAGVGLLAAVPYWRTVLIPQPWMYQVLLGLLALTVLRRALAAVLDPSSPKVQSAVKHSILSLIWLDAAIVAAVAPLPYAFAIAALLIPALLLGRWVYST